MITKLQKEEKKWLTEKIPGVEELIIYLTKFNDSIMVYVKKIYADAKDGIKIYEMSNGLSYKKSEDEQWIIIS